ncbi:MAG: carboxypeptidase-like regulatory domain-containing protein, partial [Prevotellaceae bacterium]|nr:carboxypeptidase-like regulatory domain-containing protein [Prevotellaceae bacterium]
MKKSNIFGSISRYSYYFFVNMVYNINYFIINKIKNYTLLLLLCFIGCGFGLQAQTKLSGEIVDKSNNPLPGVQVNLNNGLLQTVSDNAGKFTLTYSDTLQTRNIRFQSFGYKTKTLIADKGQQNMKVILLDSVYSLGAV